MRYAIGDIHGHLDTFLALMKELEITKNDTVYILGDLIDRGPKSCQLVETILNLIDNGYDIQCLMGNHEDLMLQAATSDTPSYAWQRNGGVSTLMSYGVYSTSTGYGNTPWQDVIPSRHWRFFCNLPTMIELDDYILVHAGLNMFAKDPIADTDENQRMWARSIDRTVGNKKYIKGKTIVSGHNIISRDEIVDLVERGATQIVLDNGIYYYNEQAPNTYYHLCCFCLDSRVLYFQPNVG